MPSPANRYYVGTGTAGSPTGWNSTSVWSTSSGGASGASIPTGFDLAIFDTHSGYCTQDVNISCTGTSVGQAGIELAATYTGTVNLSATYTTALTAITVLGGTFNTNNANITALQGFSSTGSTTRAISLGSSTLTFSSAFGITLSGSNLTFNAGTSSFGYIGIPSAATFAGGGYTFYNVTYNVTSAATLTITGSNTFNNFTANTGYASLVFPAGATNTAAQWNLSGVSGHQTTLTSSSSGTQATLASTSPVTANRISLKDIKATGRPAFYYGPGSTIVSDVSGWASTSGLLALLQG